MKKSLMIFGVAALVMTACQKEGSMFEGQNTDGLSVEATLEQQADPLASKSTLDGATVKWAVGDAVKVYDTAGKGAKLVAQSAGTSSKFNEPDPAVRDAGFDGASLSCAIYPYSSAVSCSGTEITFTLPATQTYAANTFGQDANVAVGIVSGTDVSFKNVCGVLKLQLKGAFKVSKIEISGNDDEKLWGSFKTSVTSAPVIEENGDATSEEKVLTLNCGTGVQLDPSNATTFYAVVPAGAFSSGFTAKVYDIIGTTFYVTLSTSNSNIVNRSNVRSMPEIGASRLDGINYKELSYIKNNASANAYSPYIDTEYRPNSRTEFTIDFQLKDLLTSNRRVFGSAGHTSLTEQGLGLYTNYADKWALWRQSKDDQRTGGLWVSSNINATTDRTVVSLSNTCVTINGISVSVPESDHYKLKDDDSAPYIYIFRTNDESSYPCPMTLYSVLIKENSTVVRYMIPCKNSSDNIGLYDIVNDVFYPNLNPAIDSKFIAGECI